MEVIKVKDKQFKVSIPEGEVLRQVRRVAGEINRDYAGKEPVFLAILNGSFVFAADLLREISLPSQISFVKHSSYEGTGTTGKVHELLGLNFDIQGRPVIIVEDIVETGITMQHLLKTLEEKRPESVAICTLFFKPERLKTELDIRYRCFDIPDDFIVGYGLDYDQFGRNLRDVYTII